MTESIHELMGGVRSLQGAQAKVEEVFNGMDANRDGLVSLEEFLNYCNTREDVKRSLMVSEKPKMAKVTHTTDSSCLLSLL